MKAHRIHWVTTFCLAIAGIRCASTEPMDGDSVTSLCDGSGRLRFGQKDNLGGELAQPYEQYAMAQNGVTTLLIDGRCRYWVNRSNLEGGVAGVLIGEEADDFARSVLMDDWKDFYGKLLGTACADCASSELTNGERRFGYWPALDGLEDIETIAEAVRDFKNDLFERGSPLTGDLRCHLSQLSGAEAGTEDWETQPWQAVPEGLDLSLARPHRAVDAPFDMAALIAETFLVKGALAGTLRSLRASLGERAGVYSSFIPLEHDDGRRFLLFTRDVLPFEDPDGTIDFGSPDDLISTPQS
jgi:hypothetical protein